MLKATDLLDKAWKFLSPLASLEVKNVDVWLAVYDVSVRQSTYPSPSLGFFGHFFLTSKKLQRNSSKQFELSTGSRPLILRTQNFMSD